MDWDSSNFAISPIRFEARYVSRHMDLVMARLKEHEDTQTLAEFSGVPVINGCDNKFHPCQALADLVTVYETAGSFEGQTLTYAGIHNNVANSLLIACTHVGMNLILVTPEKNAASDDAELMRRMMSKGNVERTLQFNDAAKRSQFVYTDTWVDMEFFEDESFSEEKDRRVEKMLPFQLNAENLAGSEAFILHDMPIHPGYEISAELIESPRSRIYQQAENRLYAQQALMLLLLGAGG
jgi:ornithine carbamoyltransferase